MRVRRATTAVAAAVALAAVGSGMARGAAIGDDDRAPYSAAGIAATAPLEGQAFYRASNGWVYQRAVHGTTWSAPGLVGGDIVDAPAASAPGPGRLLVAAQGTDHALWTTVGTYGSEGWTWSGWQSHGGRLDAGPAVATRYDGVTTIAVTGTDHAVHVLTRTAAGAWSGWSSRGGQVAGRPAVTDSDELYATGTDHAVWAWTTSGTHGPHWVSLGGRTNAGPGAAHSNDVNTGPVVVTGTDGHVYVKHCIWETCTGWENLGGNAGDSPAAASATDRDGTATVVVRGIGNGAFYQKTLTAAGWSAWHEAWVPGA